jgi:hypothetical protein
MKGTYITNKIYKFLKKVQFKMIENNAYILDVARGSLFEIIFSLIGKNTSQSFKKNHKIKEIEEKL